MHDTDTKPKPLPAAKQVVEVIRDLRRELANCIGDREREIRIYRRADERLVEILNRLTIAEEPTPVVATGSQTNLSAVRVAAQKMRQELDKGRP